MFLQAAFWEWRDEFLCLQKSAPPNCWDRTQAELENANEAAGAIIAIMIGALVSPFGLVVAFWAALKKGKLAAAKAVFFVELIEGVVTFMGLRDPQVLPIIAAVSLIAGLAMGLLVLLGMKSAKKG